MTTTSFARPTNAIIRSVRLAITWWLSELAKMMPTRLLGLFGKSAVPTGVLEVGASDLVYFSSGRGRGSPATVPLAGYGEDERRLRIRAALRNQGAAETVAVRLSRDLVFATSIELPLSAKTSLESILQHQIERLVPIPATEIRFAYHLRPHAPMAKRLTVDLTVAKNATIDQAIATAKSAGLRPTRVVAQQRQGSDGSVGTVILWQGLSRAAETDTQRRIRHGLELAAMLLLAIAYGLYVHRLDRVRDQLRERIAETKPQAAAAERLGQRVRQASKTASFFHGLQTQPAPLDILDRLTRLIPGDDWVTRLAVDGRNVELDGYSPQASNLISLVERSQMFANPRFRSPVTLAPDGKSQHFDLDFDIRTEPRR